MEKSLWIEKSKPKEYEKLDKDIKIDNLIIGGGIAGLTTACLLRQERLEVALVEADRIGYGTSGRNTGKITCQHGLIYSEIEKQCGLEGAKIYYEKNKEAIDFIENISEENNISCDFKRKSAFIFTEKEKYIKALKEEFKSYTEMGIPCTYHQTLDLPLNIKAAIEIPNEGQFNPKMYLDGLGDLFARNGGKIYEHTPIEDIWKEKNIALTRDGCRISYNNLIICSHMPFYDGMNLYFARLKAERSYLVAGKYEKAFPEGMYINVEEPGRTLRLYENNGEKLLLVGGEKHKVGQGDENKDYYDILKAYASDNFGIEDFKYKWSAEDYITPDHIPYVGLLNKNHKNIFVATGFGKWGMTSGVAGAIIIRNLITSKKEGYEELFCPHRPGRLMSFDIVKDNVNLATQYIKGKLEKGSNCISLNPGQSQIVHIEGERYGAYCDENNEVHIVDITCPHLGCELKFNHLEKTWDCPCHGSRYNYDGGVLEGPTTMGLKRYGEGKNRVNPHLK